MVAMSPGNVQFRGACANDVSVADAFHVGADNGVCSVGTGAQLPSVLEENAQHGPTMVVQGQAVGLLHLLRPAAAEASPEKAAHRAQNDIRRDGVL